MPPQVPAFSIERILRLRNRLIDRVFLPRYHATLSGAEFTDLVHAVRRQLPASVNDDTVFETCRQLLGVALTPAVCSRFSWLVAGNMPRLASGYTVHPWVRQLIDEWVPYQITRVEVAGHHGRAIRYEVSMLVLASTSVGNTFRQRWSQAKCRALARRVGFTAPWGKMPYQNAMQYVGLRLLGHAIAEKSREQPWFEELACTSGLQKFNRAVLKRRFKIIPCPSGFGDRPCDRCYVGYEACPAATHRKTYVQRMCPRCNETQFFDPESPSEFCVPCTQKLHWAAT